jgi:dihydropteroate synthase
LRTGPRKKRTAVEKIIFATDVVSRQLCRGKLPSSACCCYTYSFECHCSQEPEMPFAIRARFDWRLRTRTLELGPRTLIMGILNVTPDSFSDGGEFIDPERAVAHALAMLDEGADILDIGGESTRPNATPLTAVEEQARVMPVLRGILAARPDAVISIDTYHAETARAAIEAGAEIVNDVSGHQWDAQMSATCAALGCGAVLMHTRGRSREWRSLPALAADEVLPLVVDDLEFRARTALIAGIARDSIALDPGFGFGKILDENYALLARFGELGRLGFPLLAGVSRKSFLKPATKVGAPGLAPETWDSVTNPTTAANTAAILAGAHMVRVHDVRPARDAATVADRILMAAAGPAGVASS